MFQFPPAVQPVAGYEQATAPGVVEFDSNNVLFNGAIIVQFPSDIDKSSGGIAGFLSPLLYIKIIVPKGIHAQIGLLENLTAPGATPVPVAPPCNPLLSSKIQPLISMQGGVVFVQV